jgi:EAL domain-containing protein (putative c-di-GMP-specific phosphodiesterase class I)
MDLETVAEYVETDAIKDLITKIGVDYAQGYGVGKPVPLEEVLANLTDQAQMSAAS